MKAIILAAGMGKRLQTISGGLPKSMIKLGKNSILHNQINACLDYGIEKFVFVVGFKKDVLKKHILEKLDEDKVTFVENDIYDKTNTLYSLWLARDLFDDDFIYFNADVFFDPKILNHFSKTNENTQLLIEEKLCREEEVKVIVDKNRKIVEIGKLLNPDQCSGEFVGIGKFVKKDLNLFKEALEKGISEKQENNYFEFAVNEMASKTFLESVSIENTPCIEIDFPEDLENARKVILPKIKF